MSNLEKRIFELKIGSVPLQVEINNLAEQSNGSAWVKYRGTEVFAVVTMSEQEKEGTDFFPLTVNYEEKFYAAGKILGSRYYRREGKPTVKEILESRAIDRVIRPLFPEDMRREVQVISDCLSLDQKDDPTVLSPLAVSLALGISDIPWGGPIALVKVGKKEGNFILNPDYNDKDKLQFNITLGAVRKGGKILINMIECEAKEVKNEDILQAIDFSQPYLEKLINFEENIIEEIGKKKADVKRIMPSPELEKEIEKILPKSDLGKIIFQKPSIENRRRFQEAKDNLLQTIKDKYPEDIDKIGQATFIFERMVRDLVHQRFVLSKEDENMRPDGRKLDEIRPISCQVSLLPRVHGSGLFIRGATKSLSIVTLGSPGDEESLESIEFPDKKKKFMHHYNFPPYCSGEVKPLRSPNRREIGHGMLGENALRALIPEFDVFPYTIRIVTEILSSNGSTSQASICSSSLALMDAGVPIKRPAAGIAMGLMKNPEGEDYKILTDIQGVEDHYGDMDFKVAGTEKGITAIQLDVKIDGLTRKMIKETLEKAEKARLKILSKMKEVISKPRENLSPYAPTIKEIKIDPQKIGDVIGPKGKIINEIIEKYGVNIDIEPSGEVFVSSENKESVKKAIDWIKNITKEVKVGEIFQGKVKKIMDFGVFVEILPGQDGLLHISRFPHREIPRGLKMGDMIPVEVTSIDREGRIGLSISHPRSKST